MNHHRSNFKSNEELPDQPVVEASSSSNGSGGEKKHPPHHQSFSSKLTLSSQQPSSSPSSGKSNTNLISTKTYHDIEYNAPSRDIGNKPPPKLPPPSTKYLKKKDNESLVEEMSPLYPINNRPVKQHQQSSPSSSDGRKISPASVVTTSTLLKEEDEESSKPKGKSYGNMNHDDDDNKKNQPPSQPKRRNSNTGGEQEDEEDEDVPNSNKNKNMVITTDQLYGQPSQRSLLSTGDNEDLSMGGMVGEDDLSESCLSYADDDYTETSSIAGSSIADLSRASTIKSGVIAIGVVMADNGSGSSSVASRSMIADGTFSNHDDAIHQQRNNKVSLLQHIPPPSKEEEVVEKKMNDDHQDDDILSEVVAKDLAQREHDLKMKLSGNTGNGEKQVVVPRSLPRGRERLLGRSASRTNVIIESQGRPSFLLESLKREASTRILEEPEEYIVGGGAAGTTTSAVAGIPPPPPARLLQRGLSSSSFASSVASSDAESNTGGGTPRLRRGNRKRCDSASSASSGGGGGGGGLSSSDRREKVRAAMGAMGPTRRLSRSTSYRLGAGHRSSPSPSPTLASTTRKQPPPAADDDDDLVGDDDNEEEEERPSLRSFRHPSLRSTSSGLTLDENTRNEIITASSSHHQRRRTSSSGSGMRDDDIEAKIRASSSMSSQNSTARRRQSSLNSIEGRAAATATRLARRTTSSSIRPSDDKQSLRITPPAAVAAAARRSSSFEAVASSGTASVASSSTTAATSRPSDEKAAYRRGATGGIASSSSRQQEQQRPGAHAISNQNVPRNNKTEGGGSGSGGGGLSLASGDSRQPLESENPQPLEPVTSSDISSPMNDNINSNGEDADIEAQAGVPVLLPGAFAVSSMDQEDDGGYDSGFEDGSTAANEGVQVSSAAAAATSSGGGEEGDDDSPPMLRPEVPDTPLQAELYEHHVVDGLVLTVDDEDEENAKRSQRIPTFLKSFLVMVLAIIGITIFLVVSKTGSDGEGEEIVGQDDLPPELEGWSQLGEVLMGPTSTDNAKFGYSVSMSGDGSRLAIGLPGANGGDGSSTEELSGSGSVQIYDLNGTDWIKVHEISGPGNHAEAGKAVALSYDGKRVAFSAPKWEEVGFIAVYEEFLGNWSVVGEVPLGNAEKQDRWSLDLSNNGTILALGNGAATSDDGNESAGKVRVFQESNKTWALLGEEIDGDNEGILLGWSLSLSGSGDRLAVAAIGSNEYAGDVRVFGFDGVASWVRLGSILQGDESSRENFGSAVALSNDGMTVAVGSPNYAPDDGKEIGAGRVRIFRLDEDHEEAEEESSRNWIDLGDPLDGSSMFDAFGTSLALSADGRVVAVGGPENDTFGENSGHIQLFEYVDGSNNKWIQLGSDIGTPTTEGGKFGFSVAISADGSMFAGAAPEAIFDGRVNDVGEVWVFNTTTAGDEDDPMGGDE